MEEDNQYKEIKTLNERDTIIAKHVAHKSAVELTAVALSHIAKDKVVQEVDRLQRELYTDLHKWICE